MFYINSRDYLMEHQREGDYKCSILVREESGLNTRVNWLLGDPFLRAYYSIYDMDNNRIGLVGVAETLRNEKKPDIEEEEGEKFVITEPILETVNDSVEDVTEALGLDPDNPEHSNIVAILITVIGVCCVCLICNVCIYKCKKRR